MSNPNDPNLPPATPRGPLERMDWSEIREPGSYLHVASGLIARVYPEDVADTTERHAGAGGGPVVRLLPNPGAPMAVLREIAERHGLQVNA